MNIILTITHVVKDSNIVFTCIHLYSLVFTHVTDWVSSLYMGTGFSWAAVVGRPTFQFSRVSTMSSV